MSDVLRFKQPAPDAELPQPLIDRLEVVASKSRKTPLYLPSGARVWVVSEEDKIALDRLRDNASRAVYEEVG